MTPPPPGGGGRGAQSVLHIAGVLFTWDPAKAKSNEKDHDGITFKEASTVLRSGRFAPRDDEKHAGRFNALGRSRRGRPVLFIVYEKTEGGARIISARLATKKERALLP